MNYIDTFIRVAPDCPAEEGTIPKMRGGKKSLGLIQYELIAAQPYALTQEDVLWRSHVQHKQLPPEEATPAARDVFFASPRACLRASTLPKRYGWGLHFNDEGKVSLCAVESEAYQRLAMPTDDGPTVLDAMRNRRAGGG